MPGAKPGHPLLIAFSADLHEQFSTVAEASSAKSWSVC